MNSAANLIIVISYLQTIQRYYGHMESTKMNKCNTIMNFEAIYNWKHVWSDEMH